MSVGCVCFDCLTTGLLMQHEHYELIPCRIRRCELQLLACLQSIFVKKSKFVAEHGIQFLGKIPIFQIFFQLIVACFIIAHAPHTYKSIFDGGGCVTMLTIYLNVVHTY